MKELVIKLLKRKFIKFGIVGGLGTITNLIIFFIFVDVLNFIPELIASIAFFIAATQNYLINHFWTFKEHTKDDNVSFSGWLKFILTSLLGLAINIFVMKYIIINFFDPPYKVIAQFFGIISGMSINFIGSKFFVFKKNSKGDV
ncbi:MAG TPA: GtrA family protein [Spirochaetota bacterium]|nr:GtrA family protein [Spirochaetota bacterium]